MRVSYLLLSMTDSIHAPVGWCYTIVVMSFVSPVVLLSLVMLIPMPFFLLIWCMGFDVSYAKYCEWITGFTDWFFD